MWRISVVARVHCIMCREHDTELSYCFSVCFLYAPRAMDVGAMGLFHRVALSACE